MRSFKRLWIMCFLFFLTGCSSTELEERSFPMMVAVGYEDRKVVYEVAYPKDGAPFVSGAKAKDFAESKATYEERLNKQIDYNHLKVIVFEDEILEQDEQYGVMLDEIAKKEDFPRNTYVCAVDDVEDLLEMEKKLSQDLGTYLEEYLKMHEEKKEKLLTLGDLIDEKDNPYMVFYLPYLEIEDDYIEWKGYVNNKGKIWKDS